MPRNRSEKPNTNIDAELSEAIRAWALACPARGNVNCVVKVSVQTPSFLRSIEYSGDLIMCDNEVLNTGSEGWVYVHVDDALCCDCLRLVPGGQDKRCPGCGVCNVCACLDCRDTLSRLVLGERGTLSGTFQPAVVDWTPTGGGTFAQENTDAKKQK